LFHSTTEGAGDEDRKDRKGKRRRRLADLWEKAGHDVTRIGKEGGDVSEADAVLVAVPGGAIEAALENVRGLEGKTVIDATNLFGADRPSGFRSNAEFVKSRTNGPTAKSFNVNGARLYGELANARSKPGNLWTGDEEARDVVEQLNRDAGYEPLHGGPLENARAQEEFLAIWVVISNQIGPFFYRMAPPAEL
jgi:predicted dinucleotide-binding enzyme